MDGSLSDETNIIQTAFWTLTIRRRKLQIHPLAQEIKLTGFPDQQKEPDAASQVDDERDSITRIPEQIQHAKEGRIYLCLDPAVFHRRRGEDRVRWRRVGACCGSDERGREAPGDADEEEAEDVSHDDTRRWGRWVVHGGELRRTGAGLGERRALVVAAAAECGRYRTDDAHVISK